MLEKNNNLVYCDAHFHYFASLNASAYSKSDYIKSCSCSHSPDEWNNEILEKKIYHCYGMHPQGNYDQDHINFIGNLAESKLLDGIGEIGFDFCNDELKSRAKQQELFFLQQVELAIKYNLPVVIHCRKANDKLFEYSSILKKIPGVLFHSFMGPFSQAYSLLNKGINGYFSFGKQIMNNNKKAIECVCNLPIDRLLLETDAPFQTLKGESVTYLTDIIKIYNKCFEMRKENDMEDFCQKLQKNFINLYNL